jgi:hypothetical protein
MSLKEEIEKVVEYLEKLPEAVTATRLFLERVSSGESIAEALKKTAEIIALEAAL